MTVKNQSENLWEEKNSTGLNPNSSKKEENDKWNTTGETSPISGSQILSDTTKSGIYKIVNKVDGKYYVGRTLDFKQRWNEHRVDLNSGKHNNDHLRYAWDKYKEENFEFVIIEYVLSDIELLTEIEQKYLDVAEKEQDICYNLNFDARGPSRPSSLTRKKMSDSQKKLWDNDRRKEKSKTSLKMWQSDKYKETHKKAMSVAQADPKYRQWAIDHLTNLWKDSDYREKESIRRKLLYKNNLTVKNNLVRPGIRNGMYDKNIYNFLNIVTDEKFTGTQFDFRGKCGLSKVLVGDIIHRNKTRKNWKLTEK